MAAAAVCGPCLDLEPRRHEWALEAIYPRGRGQTTSCQFLRRPRRRRRAVGREGRRAARRTPRVVRNWCHRGRTDQKASPAPDNRREAAQQQHKVCPALGGGRARRPGGARLGAPPGPGRCCLGGGDLGGEGEESGRSGTKNGKEERAACLLQPVTQFLRARADLLRIPSAIPRAALLFR